MADNPGISLQFFGDRDLKDSTFNRPGTILPSFVELVVGFHGDDNIISDSGESPNRGILQTIPTQPVRSYGGGSNPGILIQGFYDTFWKNRLHIIPPLKSFGNVVTGVEGTFEIYNSSDGLKPNTQVKFLTSFALSPSNQGITILTGTVVPFILGPGDSEVYTYSVSATGVVTIDTDIVLTFGSFVIAHTATGSRSLALMWIPQREVVERWSWQTDVIKAQSGREQRNSLRPIASQTFSYTYLFDDSRDDRNTQLENRIWGSPPNLVAIPIFVDGTALTSAASPGDLVLNVVSTVDRDFRSGDFGAIVIFRSEYDFEVQSVNSFTNTTITLSSVVIGSWGINVSIYPVRFCDIIQPVSQKVWAVNAKEMTVTYRPNLNVEYSDETGFTTYKSQPVWTEHWKVQSLPTDVDWEKEVQVIAANTGKIFTANIRKFTRTSTNQFFELFSRTEFWRIKRWLGARRGQQKVFWMSTRRRDMKVNFNNVTGVTLDIANVSYAVSVFPGDTKKFRRHIEITYANGAIDYREITNAVDNGSSETLTITPASSQALSIVNVINISYLLCWRLASDTIEFNHTQPSVGSVVVPLIEANFE